MSKGVLPNRKPIERKSPRVWDVGDLLNHIKTHGDKTIYRYFEEGVLKYITYVDFAAMVEQTAAGFDRLGLKGKRIAVIGDTSPQWLATYLGALAAGSVIIPMDKELAIGEIDGFLQIVEAEAIVYSASFNKNFAPMMESHPSLKRFIPITPDDRQDEKITPFAQVIALGKTAIAEGYRIPAHFNHEEMCEMLFTSGTTGTSKCVMLCQKNIFAAANAAVDTVCFVQEDVVMSVLPVHHTYELMCLLAEMIIGLETCINDSLRHILKNLALFRPTGMPVVPMILTTMYKKIWTEAEKKGMAKKLRLGIALSNKMLKLGIDLRPKLFASVHEAFGGRLDHVICGGARLSPDLIYAFEELGIGVFQGFGITECSPLAAVEPYTARRPGSIGPAVPCCRIRVEPNGELSDDGYPLGELQIRGENVMLGYYNNPEANAEVFTEDGWFRTGDLGYMDKDGYCFITGRSKFVIVLENGKNVFPEEIEEYLDDIDLISECVVIGRKAKDGETVNLTAVVYPDYSKFPEGTADNDICEAIRAKVTELNKELPSFKKIKAVELRKTEFEKTTTKKIKRQLVK